MARGAGKEKRLWKSLYVTRGDIILWIDTDIVNIHPRFIYGLIGPLLSNPSIQFVKGFYRRPLRVGDKIQASGGGRVTELTARPLINLFYPQLSGVIQPLSGEYGGRRSVLTQLPFFSGYGVEIGLLIDVAEKFGLNAIAQVDLQERIHHNQPLEALSKMSFAIIQAVSRKLENSLERNFLNDVNKTMKLVRYNSGHFFLDVEEIAEQERPPMLEVPEYLEKLNQPSLMTPDDQVLDGAAWRDGLEPGRSFSGPGRSAAECQRSGASAAISQSAGGGWHPGDLLQRSAASPVYRPNYR